MIAPVYQGATMFTIDRFVLSQVEKFTQSLQRNFGIKISSIVCFFSSIMLTCIFMSWYFVGMPTGITKLVSYFNITVLLLYIFFISKRHQIVVDRWAAQGISNPLKVHSFFTFGRLLVIFQTIIYSTLFVVVNADTDLLIHLLMILSLLVFAYAVCVDVLPPSNSKAGNWLKNLFRKVSLST